MADIEQIMTRLAEATDSELTEALAAISEEVNGLREGAVTEETVGALERYAEARTAIVGEQNRRGELANRAAAVFGQFDDSSAVAAGEPETAPESEGAAEPPGDGAEGGDGEPGSGTEGESDAVTASGRKLGGITKAAKGGEKGAELRTAQASTITRAVGGSARFAAGEQLNRETLSEAMLERFNTVRGTSVEGRQTVARVEFAYPEERVLSADASDVANTRKIEAVTGPEAIVAAGGLCAPLETLYDITTIGLTARPVRDALSRFQVDRGGIQYRMPMDALAMTDGLGVWTVTDDAAVSNPPDGTPEKTCAVIECPGVEDAVVQAIYLCLQYPNFTARFDREWVDATTRAALIAQARFAENQLLTQLYAGSKFLYAGATQVSATRDILVAIDKLVAYYRNRHRLDTMVPLRMILPRWVLDVIRADLCRSMGSAYDVQVLGVADSLIQTFFRNRGVNVTFHLDGLAAATVTPPGAGNGDVPAQFYSNAAAGSAIPNFITKIDSVLYAEGDWLFLDGGTLDLGMVRDSQLNAINRYQTFIETWEGTAFRGIESLRVAIPITPTGGTSGTIDPITLTN